MSDTTTRTRAVLVAALTVGSAALADLIQSSADQGITVNLHTATGILSQFAVDAAAFAVDVDATPAEPDDALTARVTHIETVLVQAGLIAAPAPTPAAPPAPAPDANPAA